MCLESTATVTGPTTATAFLRSCSLPLLMRTIPVQPVAMDSSVNLHRYCCVGGKIREPQERQVSVISLVHNIIGPPVMLLELGQKRVVGGV